MWQKQNIDKETSRETFKDKEIHKKKENEHNVASLSYK